MSDDLTAVLARRTESVARRIQNSGESPVILEAITNACNHVSVLVGELRLGEFVADLTPPTGKPQLLLLFEGPSGLRVLKTYGRHRLGEGHLQVEATTKALPVVPTYSFADDPYSHLLMKYMAGGSVTAFLDRHSSSVHAVTSRAAECHYRLSHGALTGAPRYRNVADATYPIAEKGVSKLREHGYAIPVDWKRIAEPTLRPVRPSVIHGDSFSGNSLFEVDPVEDLVLSDCSAVVGDHEFDAARWIIREATIHSPSTPGADEFIDELTNSWMAGAPHGDRQLIETNLPLQALIAAGNHEIRKDEVSGAVATEPTDPLTLTLLALVSDGLVRFRQNRIGL